MIVTVAEEGEYVVLSWARRSDVRTESGLCPTMNAAIANRFEVQWSANGSSGWTTLSAQMPHIGSTEVWSSFSEGSSPSVPPLEEQMQWGTDRFYHWNPTVGMNYYRVREIQYENGSVLIASSFSDTVSINYQGDDVPNLGSISFNASSYNPPDISGIKLLLYHVVGMSRTNSYAAVDNLGVSNLQLKGPAYWRTQVQSAIDKGFNDSRIAWDFKDAAGNFLFVRDNSSAVTTEALELMIFGSWHPTNDTPPYSTHGSQANDSTCIFPNMWWRGAQHLTGHDDLYAPSQAVGAQLKDIVETYHENLSDVQGFCYLSCPVLDIGSVDTGHLLEKSHILPALLANHFLILGTAGVCAITDPITGLKTGVARFLDWWHTTFPGKWIFLEPALRRQRGKWFIENDTYPYAGGWSAFHAVFKDSAYNSTQTIQLETSGAGTNDDALDPRAYPNRYFIILVTAGTCLYIRNSTSNEQQVDRLIQVANSLWAYSPNIIVDLGHDQFILANASPTQIEDLVLSLPDVAGEASLNVTATFESESPVAMEDGEPYSVPGGVAPGEQLTISITNNGGAATTITSVVKTDSSGTTTVVSGTTGTGLSLTMAAGQTRSWVLEIASFTVAWIGNLAFTATQGDWMNDPHSNGIFVAAWYGTNTAAPAAALHVSVSFDGSDLVGMTDQGTTAIGEGSINDVLTVRVSNQGTSNATITAASLAFSSGAGTILDGDLGTGLSLLLEPDDYLDWQIVLDAFSVSAWAGTLTLTANVGDWQNDVGSDGIFVAGWSGTQAATDPLFDVQIKRGSEAFASMYDVQPSSFYNATVGEIFTIRVTNNGSGTGTITSALVNEYVGDVTVTGTTGTGLSLTIAASSYQEWTFTIAALSSGTLEVVFALQSEIGDWSSDADPADGYFQALLSVLVNNAPSIFLSSEIGSYQKGSGPQAIDSGLTISDPNLDELVGATITISRNYDPVYDVIAFSDQLGISGSWNADTGTLTLTGTAPISSYQTALRAATFANSDTANISETRSFTFSVDDGTDEASDTKDYLLSPSNTNTGHFMIEITSATRIAPFIPAGYTTDQVEQVLNWSEDFIRSVTDRPDGFKIDNHVEYFDGKNHNALILRYTPIDITEDTTVTYLPTGEIIDPEDYSINPLSGVLKFNDSANVRYRSGGDLAGSYYPGKGPVFRRGFRQFEVDYYGGYETNGMVSGSNADNSDADLIYKVVPLLEQAVVAYAQIALGNARKNPGMSAEGFGRYNYVRVPTAERLEPVLSILSLGKFIRSKI